MRKILLLSILVISFTCVKAQYYQLGFDSVRVKSKLKLGSVTTGSVTDSVLVKKGNGGVYKMALSVLFQDRIRYGATLVTFDGTATVFNIPHGMGTTPTSFALTFGNAANDNFVKSTRTITSTNIVLTCDSPPLTGSQTVYWQVFK